VSRPTRDETHAQIRGCALELFVAQGFGGTSLSQIAAAVGYSKAALLYHVSSKEALLADVLEQPAADLRAAVDELASQPAGPERRPAVVQRYVELALAHRLELALLVRDGERFLHLAPVADLAEVVQELRRLLVADDAPLADQVRVSMALVGLAATALQHADASPELLRAALVDAALAVLPPA
jgi:AcrR family transcriptional regulator